MADHGAKHLNSMRRRVCSWLNQTFQCNIDPDDPSTFASALADGVVLCKAARALLGTKFKFKSKKPNVFQRNENINLFSKQCVKAGVPAICTPAPSDIAAGNWDQVVGCLLRIYHLGKAGKLKLAQVPKMMLKLRRSDFSKDELAQQLLDEYQKRPGATPAAGTENLVSPSKSAVKMVVGNLEGVPGLSALVELVRLDVRALTLEELRSKLDDIEREHAQLQAQAGPDCHVSLVGGPSFSDAASFKQPALVLFAEQKLAECYRIAHQLRRAECEIAQVPAEYLLQPPPMPQDDVVVPTNADDDPDGDENDDDLLSESDPAIIGAAKRKLDGRVAELTATVSAGISMLQAEFVELVGGEIDAQRLEAYNIQMNVHRGQVAELHKLQWLQDKLAQRQKDAQRKQDLETLANSDDVAFIASQMRHNAEDVAVLAKACEALGNIWQRRMVPQTDDNFDPENPRIPTHDTELLIVAALRTFPKHSTLQAWALRAAKSMVDGFGENIILFTDATIMDCVHAAMLAHPLDPLVQAWCCGALREFVYCQNHNPARPHAAVNKAKIKRRGSAALVLANLRTFSTDPLVLEMVTDFLWNFCCNDDEAVRTVIDAGGVTALGAVLEHSKPEYGGAVARTCAALYLLHDHCEAPEEKLFSALVPQVKRVLVNYADASADLWCHDAPRTAAKLLEMCGEA